MNTTKPLNQKAWWLILPVVLVLVAGLLGFTQQYPAYGDTVMLRMRGLIQEGLNSRTPEELPASLRPPHVNLFLDQAKGSYTLQWDKDQGNRYALPRFSGSIPDSVVIARFENGYLLVCVFTTPDHPDTCKDFHE